MLDDRKYVRIPRFQVKGYDGYVQLTSTCSWFAHILNYVTLILTMFINCVANPHRVTHCYAIIYAECIFTSSTGGLGNVSWPSNAYLRPRNLFALAEIIAWCRIGAKPLSKPLLIMASLGPHSMTFNSISIQTLSFSFQKWAWKYHLLDEHHLDPDEDEIIELHSGHQLSSFPGQMPANSAVQTNRGSHHEALQLWFMEPEMLRRYLGISFMRSICCVCCVDHHK